MYSYEPLLFDDSIRLLILEPSSDPASDLTGSLLHTTITECVNDLIEGYTALSYVWGNPAKTGSIVLEGRACHITANLEAALRDIRNGSRPHRIWADALCINQDDKIEKNKQVGLMGLIYSKARNTIIYLGALTPGAESLLTTASSENEEHDDETVTRMRKFADDDLLLRDWFTRVWIFQELVLSNDPWVQCGRPRARWSNICAMLLPKRPKDIDSRLDTPQQQMLQKMEKARGAVRPCLAECLEARRGYGTTYYQDLVYAQLGVVSDAAVFSQSFPVAYTKSWRQVFTDAAIHIFQYNGIRHLCSHHTRIRKFESEGYTNASFACPSWVPDWNLKYPYRRPIYQSLKMFEKQDYLNGRENHILKQGTKDIIERSRMHPSDDIILCRSHTTDKIEAVTNIVPTAPSLDPASWEEFGRCGTISIPTKMLTAALQTIQTIYPYWDVTSDTNNLSSARLLHSLTELMVKTKRSSGEPRWKDVYEIDPLLLLLWEYMNPTHGNPALEGRRFALTFNGSIGIVPAEARIGDVIVWGKYWMGIPITLIRLAEELGAAQFDSQIRECMCESIGERSPIMFGQAGSYDSIHHCISVGESYFADVPSGVSRFDERNSLIDEKQIFAIH